MLLLKTGEKVNMKAARDADGEIYSGAIIFLPNLVMLGDLLTVGVLSLISGEVDLTLGVDLHGVVSG